MLKGLLKTKTFWMSLAGILGTVGALVAKEVTITTGLLAIAGFIVAIFIRDAVAKI